MEAAKTRPVASGYSMDDTHNCNHLVVATYTVAAIVADKVSSGYITTNTTVISLLLLLLLHLLPLEFHLASVMNNTLNSR